MQTIKNKMSAGKAKGTEFQKKPDLEESLKDKILPLLEESMEKSWGITIPKIESDISDRLKNPQLNIYINTELSFPEAKKKFKKEFLKRELRLHKGNISQLARMLDLDRRSVHRTIKDLGINLEEIRSQGPDSRDYHHEFVDRAIRSALEQYRGLIQRQQMEKMYQEVDNLSRNIAKFVPQQEMSWKEAENEFERQFLSLTVKENVEKGMAISQIARKIRIRPETLYRKIKKFGLGKR